MIVAVAALAGFVLLVAVTVTVRPTGAAGAKYLPVAVMRPTTLLPRTMPLTAQVTAPLATPSA